MRTRPMKDFVRHVRSIVRSARRIGFIVALAAAGCTHNLRALQEPGRAAAAPTPYWSNLVYAARTDSGVVVVDLGWQGAEGALRRVLRRVGAAPADVTDVFVTHSHRDHIGAWRAVRHARFHLAAGEVPLFEGRRRHGDLPSRASGAVLGWPGPWGGEVEVRPFSRDTAFAFGADTVRAFLVPGHTPGSAAYLVRGVLFAGDAVIRDPLTGFGPSRPLFTDDTALSRRTLRDLLERAAPYAPRWLCNAHSKCAPFDSTLVRKLTR